MDSFGRYKIEQKDYKCDGFVIGKNLKHKGSNKTIQQFLSSLFTQKRY